MAWKITNALKKQATEVEYFTKDGKTITREHGWRWASVTVLDKPDLSKFGDPEEDFYVDGLSDFGDVIDQDSTDGCWEDWTYPEDMTEEEREEIEAAWEEDWSLEGLGWESADCELRFWGPLDVEEVETPAYAILPAENDG